MIYLGENPVGLNQLLAKNIPLKWDIVEYISADKSRKHTIYHNLGTIPDICIIIPDVWDGPGQTNPIMLFCANGSDGTYNKLVNNYIDSTTGNWNYTANPNAGAGYYYNKDAEKIEVYAGTNNSPIIVQNKKYYIIFIKFNTDGGDT